MASQMLGQGSLLQRAVGNPFLQPGGRRPTAALQTSRAAPGEMRRELTGEKGQQRRDLGDSILVEVGIGPVRFFLKDCRKGDQLGAGNRVA